MACSRCLKEEVLAMEKGTETVIGSGGTRLSGGQAQRLALARTLAHPRPVLVLDDPSRHWTAAPRMRSLPNCRRMPEIRWCS